MSIFDPMGVGTISFRELLITFALSMEAPLIEKLNWTYRLYDEEGQGEIYLDDLVQIVWKLCELTKSAEVLLKDGPPKAIERNEEQNEEVETLVRSKATPKDHNSSIPPPAPKQAENIKLLSNKLGHRVESAKQKRRERPSSKKTE
ncbi:neurocalcin-delta A-like [Tigriopus californicus]|uniref:neurocalcin-delta A-like n=1 Tax=Tigriopus californicus TaxID=6832 RepID=UPI0027DA0F69|nr:neurocalcin-delta A-like [Tigriopus californicus]